MSHTSPSEVGASRITAQASARRSGLSQKSERPKHDDRERGGEDRGAAHVVADGAPLERAAASRRGWRERSPRAAGSATVWGGTKNRLCQPRAAQCAAGVEVRGLLRPEARLDRGAAAPATRESARAAPKTSHGAGATRGPSKAARRGSWIRRHDTTRRRAPAVTLARRGGARTRRRACASSRAASGTRWSASASPFLEWEWLASLEEAGCVGPRDGLGAAPAAAARGRAARRRLPALREGEQRGRVRVRLRLGGRRDARGHRLLPEAARRRALHAGERRAAPHRAGRRPRAPRAASSPRRSPSCAGATGSRACT